MSIENDTILSMYSLWVTPIKTAVQRISIWWTRKNGPGPKGLIFVEEDAAMRIVANTDKTIEAVQIF